MPLHDNHLALLQAASRHRDGLLARPERLGGIVLHRMAALLIKAGAAEVVGIDTDQPAWRKGASGEPEGLRITDAGRAALKAWADNGTTVDRSFDTLAMSLTFEPAAKGSKADKRAAATVEPRQNELARAGSKQALLRQLLGRRGGVTAPELSSTLGWQPHTLRAALTRLRQIGMPIARGKDDSGCTVYGIDLVDAAAEGGEK